MIMIILGALPYIGILFVEILVYFFSKKIKNKAIVSIVFFSTVGLLFLFSILKSDVVGNDTAVYKSVFNETVKTGTIKGNSDRLFYFLFLAFSKLSNSFFAFQIAFYFLYYSIIAISIYLISDDPFLSLIIFTSSILFLMALSGIRQSLAISLCALSFSLFIKCRKLITKILSAVPWLISIFIHSSSAIFGFFFIFSFVGEITIKKIKISIFVFFGSLIFLKYLFGIIYAFKDLTYFISSSNTSLPFSALIHFVLLLILSWVAVCDKNVSYSPNEKIVISSCFCCTLAYSCFLGTSTFSDMMSRFGYFYAFPLVILIPLILNKYKNNNHFRLMLFGTISCFVIYFVYISFVANSLGTFPFVWRF